MSHSNFTLNKPLITTFSHALVDSTDNGNGNSTNELNTNNIEKYSTVFPNVLSFRVFFSSFFLTLKFHAASLRFTNNNSAQIKRLHAISKREIASKWSHPNRNNRELQFLLIRQPLGGVVRTPGGKMN